MEQTSTGYPLRVLYVSNMMAGVDSAQLAAAVVWRWVSHDPRSGAQRWAGWSVAWLRRLRHRMWLRFGPLGLDVHWGIGEEDAREGVAVGGFGFLEDVEPRVYFDGRVVRLLGRVYHVPADERTLVLLVEEGGEQRASGRRTDTGPVAIRTVLIPSPRTRAHAATTPSRGDSAGHEASAAQIVTVSGGSRPEWDAALSAHPEVRAFMMAASDA